METLISIILWIVATITGLAFFLQCLNMVLVLYKGRGKAEISILNAAVAVVTLYILWKL